MSHVRTQHADSIGTITIDRTDKRNALSQALVEELLDAVRLMEEARVRVLILRAPPGARVWSAGHDVGELPPGGRDPLAYTDPLRVLIRAIEDFPSPVIALVEGTVWGGACELALACDLIVAAPTTTFAITPARLSVPYNVGGLLTLMSQIPLAVLKEMAFTGEPMAAPRLLALGIINHVQPEGELEPFTLELARRIARNAPLSVRAMKKSINVLAASPALPPFIFEMIQGERRKVWDSADYKEGLAAFRERREPRYRGE